MTERALLARIENDAIDMKTGRFPMVLATDGEASDGDILSIEGAQWSEQAPLQNAHINEAKSTLGSVTRFRRDLTGTPKKLRAEGQIEMEGEGSQAEIRRDIAFMIGRKHIRGVSVRWEPMEWVRRVNLPEDHPHYVNGETEKDPWKRYGLFYKKWRVLEGSIAPVQADPASMIGRADETEGDVSEFWRTAAADIEARRKALEELSEMPDPSQFEDRFDYVRAALVGARSVMATPEDAEAECLRRWDEAHPDPDADKFAKNHIDAHLTNGTPSAAEVTPEARKAAFAAYLRELSDQHGVPVDELAAIVDEHRANQQPTAVDLAKLIEAQKQEIAAMRAQLESLEKNRVHGAPVPPLNTIPEIINHIDSMLGERRKKALAAAKAMIEKRVGKIDPNLMTYRELIHADAQKLVDEIRAKRQPEQPPEDPVALASLLGQLESLIQEKARAREVEKRASQE